MESKGEHAKEADAAGGNFPCSLEELLATSPDLLCDRFLPELSRLKRLNRVELIARDGNSFRVRLLKRSV